MMKETFHILDRNLVKILVKLVMIYKKTNALNMQEEEDIVRLKAE